MTTANLTLAHLFVTGVQTPAQNFVPKADMGDLLCPMTQITRSIALQTSAALSTEIWLPPTGLLKS
jgi:hypothetical protein